MRKALVVGINYYEHVSQLYGCVKDALAVQRVLARNGDDSPNFSVRASLANTPDTAITWAALKDEVRELFADDSEVALFYFAGHGHIEATGGYICGSDCRRGDDALPLRDVLTLANKSFARNKIIMLDSCFSGIAGTTSNSSGTAELGEGLTILTASTEKQYASEENSRGVFSALLTDALEGAASNLVGEITPGSVYAHIDQSLGPWKQRPVFKTNVKNFVSLRRVRPPIDIVDLRRITEFFPDGKLEFPLDPTFEPERGATQLGVPPPNPVNTAKFAVLQRYNRVNLVVPIDAPHMWHAAMESKACRLTALGEHYRRLVAEQLI